MSAIEHIMHGHSFNSGFSNVSKFSKGTAVKMIKKYVDEALQHGIPMFKNNSYQLCYDLKKVIGIGSNGEIASKIMIYIKDGWIRTVFPTN